MNWLLPALALALSYGIHLLLLRPALRGLAMDQPNERSLHQVPIPRTGGVAIVLAATVALSAQSGALPMTILGAMLGAVSLADDRLGLPVVARLALHLGAAVWAAWVVFPNGGLGLILIALAIAWMTNLFNFMDGSDALAGGMALLGFSSYACAAGLAGESGWALAFLGVAAAAAGFLAFNWPPARIFMGDVGSIPLGFWAAAFGALGAARGWWPVWFPAASFSPFIVDATTTLARRAHRGEKVWRAHRQHYYQRLVLAGWSKRKLLARFLALALVVQCWALLTLRLEVRLQAISMVSMAAAYVALMLWIDVRLRGTSRQ